MIERPENLAGLIASRETDLLIVVSCPGDPPWPMSGLLMDQLGIKEAELFRLNQLARQTPEQISIAGRRNRRPHGHLKALMCVPFVPPACAQHPAGIDDCQDCPLLQYAAFEQALLFGNRAWNASRPAVYIGYGPDSMTSFVARQAYRAAAAYHDPRHHAGFSSLIFLCEQDTLDAIENLGFTPAQPPPPSSGHIPHWLESRGGMELIHLDIEDIN